MDDFCGTTIALSIDIHHRNTMETDMDSTANLLAALRRVRSFPSYTSFMAGHERQRIKRELQKRLLRLRRQRQSHKLNHFATKRQETPGRLLQTILH
jgi:predicted RecB family nuclease